MDLRVPGRRVTGRPREHGNGPGEVHFDIDLVAHGCGFLQASRRCVASVSCLPDSMTSGVGLDSA
ncbi:MAG TPA: hypothetical protein VNC79_00425, partial [Mycobacteriales bacterium]|nr:hypothetical protein [Mycobacteriales bacterium]